MAGVIFSGSKSCPHDLVFAGWLYDNLLQRLTRELDDDPALQQQLSTSLTIVGSGCLDLNKLQPQDIRRLLAAAQSMYHQLVSARPEISASPEGRKAVVEGAARLANYLSGHVLPAARENIEEE